MPLTTLQSDGPNRAYYQRKRAEGRKHQQALVALARHRVDVLWVLLRDNRPFETDPRHGPPGHRPPHGRLRIGVLALGGECWEAVGYAQ